MNSKYKELTDKAFYFHQRGDLETAEKIYNALLEIDPDDANILNLLGVLMLSKDETLRAIDYLTKSFIINRSAQVANNLAKAYYNANMFQKAVKMFLESLNIEKSDDTYYSLGLTYKQLGENEKSISAYMNALELNPGNYSACYNLALLYSDMGNIDKALFYAKRCTLLRNDDESLFGVLSSLYEKTNEYDLAIQALEKAAALNPNNFLYYYNLAVLNSMVKKDDKAVFYYLKAISLNPNNIESYVNLANLIKKQDGEKAVKYLLKAYEINPNEETLLLSLAQSYKDIYKNDDSIKILKELLMSNPECDSAYSIIAMNYMDMCEYEKALQYYEFAIKLNPNNLNYRHGRAVALKYLGKTDECREILENLVSNNEVSTETKITLGMLYLQNKEFKNGMELYRLRANNIKSKDIKREDIWEPYEEIKDKTIVVYSNCGLGDSIMYSRYLPLLKDKAKEVILQTDKELSVIMQESFSDISVITKSTKPPKYDKILQFMDIALALNMNFDDIPEANGYLKANNELINMFSALNIFKSDKKKIGLFWQGNKRIFKNRSIKYEIIKKLTENKKYNFYSFQKDTKIEETENFFDLSEHIKDYSDTAALLKNIDLLVTIDSSIVHMAGALGVKTYLLLPKTAEWRWFDDTKNTPWYDSVTIFKQTQSNDWDEVINRVLKSL